MAEEEVGEGRIVLSGDATDFNNAIDDAIGGIFSLNTAIAAAGATLGFFSAKAIGNSIQAMSGFEQRMAEVRKVINPANTDIQRLSEGIRELAVSDLPLAQEELAKIASGAARLGIEGTPNILEFTKTVGQLATVTQLSGDEIADTFGRILNMLGLAPDMAQEVGSAVNELGNRMASDAERIVSSLSRLAPTLRAAGATSQEIIGLAGAVSTLRESERRAATRLRRVFQEFQNIETIQRVAEAFGMNTQALRGMIDQNPVQFILKLSKAMNQNRAVADALSRSLTSRAVMSLRALGQATGDAQRAIGIANSQFQEANSLSEEMAIFVDTLNNRWKNFKEIVHDIAIEVGQFFKPAVLGVLGLLTTMAEDFRDINRATNGALGGLILLTGTVFGLAIALRAVQKVFSFTFFSAFPKARKLILGLFSPLTKLRLAFILLTAAVTALFTVWRTDFLGLRKPIENFFNILTKRLLEPVNRHFPAIRRELGQVVKGFIRGFNQVKKATEGLWKPALAAFVAIHEVAFDIVVGVIRTFFDFWFTVSLSILHFLQGEWKQGIQAWAGFIDRTLDGIIGFFEKWGVVDFLKGVISDIKGLFKDFANWLIGNSFIQDTFNSVVSWLKSTFKPKILSTLGNIVSKIISKVQEGLDWLAKLGQNSGANVSLDAKGHTDPTQMDRFGKFLNDVKAPTPTPSAGGRLTDKSMIFEKVEIHANSRGEGREAARGLKAELHSNNIKNQID